MFQLRLSDIEEALGHEEAIRLDGFLKLQKSSSGVRSFSMCCVCLVGVLGYKTEFVGLAL